MVQPIAVPHVCLTTGTQLHSAESDGARCGEPRHFHARTGSGFAGARPVAAPVSFHDVSPERAE